MHPPKLLAINDVHLTGLASSRAALLDFYVGGLGFESVDDGHRIVLRGWPRSGPRLVVDFAERLPAKPMRRQAVIQVDSLGPLAATLDEHRIAYEWSSGWFFFDRRLGVLDPGGNWIEVVASHAW